jgi:apolipoprotein N-acyltransferase
MSKGRIIILSVLSGILFVSGWPVNGFPAFLFMAFVPLLIIEKHISENPHKYGKFSVFFYTFPAFFIWNFATTYWIWNSTPVAALAWILNSMFMSIVFQSYHYVRKNVYGGNKGIFVLLFLWITFEFIHLNWKLTWPWLNLGHGFATYTRWIQWYEYTGIHGGTLWILLLNLIFFKIFFQGSKTKRTTLLCLGIAFSMILFPILISQLIYFSYEEKSSPVRIIITQPNLDPYSEQYTVDPLDVVNLNLNLAEQLLDEETRFIVAPESAIQESIWEGHYEWAPSLSRLSEFVRDHPQLGIVIGASTFRSISEGEDIPQSARFHEKLGFYYDRYNTAFLLDTAMKFQKHHKSKLTPGVEYMPAWGPLSFLENMAIDLGGTVGSLGVDKEQNPFLSTGKISIAPLICYESVYGEFTGKFINNGAELIFVITNDGWWGDTPGYKQHLYFSPLRAIETRRSIARSANTGISCFVDQKGNIHQPTPYWEPGAIKQDINLNQKITFYTSMGDYIGRVSAFLSVVFILIAMVLSLRGKKRFLT